MKGRDHSHEGGRYMFNRVRGGNFKLDQDRGASMIEFSMVLPFLILFFSLTVDVGRALDEYFSLIRTARDAAQIGTRIPSLSTTEVASVNIPCKSFGDSTTDCEHATNHLSMHKRAAVLLNIKSQEVFDATTSSTRFESTFIPADEVIVFTIKTDFKPHFIPLVDSFPLKVSVTSPHLYN